MFSLSPAQRAVVEMLRPEAGGPDAMWRRARIDWAEALAFANAHFLGPAVHSSLTAAGRTEELPPDVMEYLALLHGANARRNHRLARQAHELVMALNEAGIQPLLLKGTLALVGGAVCDPAARMLRDLDILVPGGAERAAVVKLEALGYAAITRYPAGHHAYGDFGRAGDVGAVDLHFELTDVDYVLRAHEVRRRARRITWRGASLLLPSATDAVLHNVLHAQVHHRGDYYRGAIELRQVHDLAALDRDADDTVDWHFVGQRLDAHRLRIPLESHLLAAHRLFGMAWPLERPASLRARIHHRRCLAHQRVPALTPLTAPWANLRRAFARHRMDGLYAKQHPLVLRQLQHMRGVLRKGGFRLAVDRLLRTR